MDERIYLRRITEHELTITKPTVIRFYRRGKKLHYSLPKAATGGIERLTNTIPEGHNSDSRETPDS